MVIYHVLRPKECGFDMIELPDGIFEDREVRAMPPSERNAYNEKTIEKILDMNTNRGISVEDVFKATNFDRRTISKHLELLVARRIAYKTIQGNTMLYYKNGRLIHHIFKKDIDLGKRSFSFKALFDGNEVLIYIQENKKSPIGIIEEGGGIIVPLKHLEEFTSCVANIESEIPLIKNELKNQLLKVVE